MRAYIKKLQSKPEDARKRILLVSLITSMSFVVLIWVYGLGGLFSGSNDSQTNNSLKPFTLLANSVSDAYQNISASVGNISSISKKSTSSKQIDLIPVETPANQ
ncbi:MAG: hypothetical protein KGI58_03445 [Patescibacteria group bacterium]|nr:hypothetical protein [Patescibacteria group bacterium]